jgi:predicted ester cyclase
MPGENKATVRRLWDEVYNQRRLDSLSTIATPREVEEVKRFHSVLTGGMPDLRVEVLQLLEEGDLVADVVVFHGTQTGPLTLPGMSHPPTGKVFAVRMVNVWRLESGRIAEHWGQWDVLGFLRTLGVSPGGPGGKPPGAGPSGPPPR